MDDASEWDAGRAPKDPSAPWIWTTDPYRISPQG